MNEKIRSTHLERRAAVYLRQSTLKQVHEHRESTTRQYALRQRAVALGWDEERVDVIDDDLGQSGASSDWREGFQRLAESVAHGRVGAIFALEVSRLSRSSADWHQLLQLCGLADVLLIDEQAVYSPSDYNDRLLLGLKGTMSEAEQYWMRLRLEGGRLSKARRGELFMTPPAGYEWNATTRRFRFDPDEHVQRAVRLVFDRFRLDGTAYGVARYFLRHGLKIPARELGGSHPICWREPSSSLVLRMLHSPIYAGAYVFGRSEERLRLIDGKLRRRHVKRFPQEAWKTCLRDHHPAYISWEEFMTNQRKLHDNRTNLKSEDPRGAAREGHALLQGLVLCGRCGHRMHVQYSGPTRRPVYDCYPKLGSVPCWNVPARPLDEAVAKLFLDAMNPSEIELGLLVVRETERQATEIDRQWQLRRERVRYEAQLAERRYKAVDPDNRVIARTLEREWNDKLAEVEELDREHQEVRRHEKVELTEEDRARIVSLAKDLPAVWSAETTTPAERKNLLRMVVREVTLSPIDVPRRMTRVQVLWETGATSDFTVPRKDKYVVLATPPQALALLRRLFAEKKTDLQIAKELNRLGFKTGVNRAWDIAAVRRVRYNHGMYRESKKARRAPDRRDDGLYSVHAVAARMDVPPSVVRYWARTGVLEPVFRGGPGHPHWFKLDPATLDHLKEARAKCHVLPSRTAEEARAHKNVRLAGRAHAGQADPRKDDDCPW
jgi:DNA invertase Pin-like site-specific DNA recombinase